MHLKFYKGGYALILIRVPAPHWSENGKFLDNLSLNEWITLNFYMAHCRYRLGLKKRGYPSILTGVRAPLRLKNSKVLVSTQNVFLNRWIPMKRYGTRQLVKYRMGLKNFDRVYGLS